MRKTTTRSSVPRSEAGQRAAHIGIVACSAEGAALCYRTLCTEGARFLGRYAHPEVSLHTHPFSSYMCCLEAGDWDGVAELMLSSAEKLVRGGAEFLICPDNTIHQAFDRVLPRSPVPWLHIAEEVAREAARRGFSHLGVLGTTWLMEGPVYPEKLAARGIRWSLPQPEDRQRVHAVIFDELVQGVLRGESRSYLIQVIRQLGEAGCDAAVLGCTELPLLVAEEDSPLPILDSTRILARAALRRATVRERDEGGLVPRHRG